MISGFLTHLRVKKNSKFEIRFERTAKREHYGKSCKFFSVFHLESCSLPTFPNKYFDWFYSMYPSGYHIYEEKKTEKLCMEYDYSLHYSPLHAYVYILITFQS